MLCNRNAPLAKLIGIVVGIVVDHLPLTVFVEISFSPVGRGIAYNVRGPKIVSHLGH